MAWRCPFRAGSSTSPIAPPSSAAAPVGFSEVRFISGHTCQERRFIVGRADPTRRNVEIMLYAQQEKRLHDRNLFITVIRQTEPIRVFSQSWVERQHSEEKLERFSRSLRAAGEAIACFLAATPMTAARETYGNRWRWKGRAA